MGVIQEGIHTIHSKSLKYVVLKINLSKPYDRVDWTYLRILLSKMGFVVPFITWVMSILIYVSFALLTNGVASSFFRSRCGLKKGFPLAPLLFLIVVEGLCRAFLSAKECGAFKGITFGNNITLSHVLFVDDIVMVSDGYKLSLSTLYEVLMVFCKAFGMVIN